MREFVVFYAWQSDRPLRLNKHLIRAALDFAAKSISDDPTVGVRMRIDADTERVIGHIPVTDTILNKIAVCDAFVPDLTFVAQTPDDKMVPNPNVMLEYGYALGTRSHSIMMPVMNSTYGPPERLPFDMGHRRHPIQFALPPTAKNAERRAVRQSLAKEFEEILRAMVAETKPAFRTPFPEARASSSPAFFFRPGAMLAEAGLPGEQQFHFEGDKAIYLRLFPKYSEEQPRIGRARLRALFYEQRIVNPMSLVLGGVPSSNDFGWITIDPSGASATRGITQAFASGELWGVSSKIFVHATYARYIAPDQRIEALAVIGAERLYKYALKHYLSVATGVLKLKLPYVVEFGAVGLKDVYMGAPHPEASSGHYYGPIRVPSLVRRYELVDSTLSTIDRVLRSYFDDLYDLAECSRDELLTDQVIAASDLPSRNPR